MEGIPFAGKFGGATGNLNAHKLCYPSIDWPRFADDFVQSLGLVRSRPTTQIEHYDHLSALLDNWKRINTILIDFCQDMWVVPLHGVSHAQGDAEGGRFFSHAAKNQSHAVREC